MPKKAQQKNKIKRIFADQIQAFTDLFQLSTASMTKNISFNESPQLVHSDHQHFFHTVDSSGKMQKYCAPVGGHFHEMEIERDADGDIVEARCVSGPLKFATRRVNGKYRKVPVPFNEFDKHKHSDVEYLRSSEVEKRKVSPEAVKVMSQQIAKETSKKVTGPDGQPLADLKLEAQPE